MYCSSEFARSYSLATRQVLHLISYSHVEHTKCNLCVCSTRLSLKCSMRSLSHMWYTSMYWPITQIKLNNTHVNGTSKCINLAVSCTVCNNVVTLVNFLSFTARFGWRLFHFCCFVLIMSSRLWCGKIYKHYCNIYCSSEIIWC